ncbi:MAG: phosphoenolpyruvate carboxykinase (ATP) [Synergistaceae bacterium]|nr:phosphoenolpyruvate carboxykinase (ATP) [Synergistaceae bacterium]MBQ7569459.1 phosphoenolpyruvate carboxykinase (ATP) [Synergistaceae bacterium]MBQ9581265.1 phosphoenolpyruvate carboxykinase (ATP) [Synergistaceae bacterium]MBQ9897009.1 phosphoenolpyruvate carboxykinase (ATP) [Synergistaceae bacterium]
MSTIGYYDESNFKKIYHAQPRTTIESLFYGNNVHQVLDLKEAYNLAKNSPGTVVLDGMPVYKPTEQELPQDAQVLLFNDGAIFGRTAAARRIVGYPDVDTKALCTILREAVYNMRYRKLYKADAYIGLDEDFMTKAHIILPEGYENNLYNWMINFQYANEKYNARYENSRKISDVDGDIFIIADPEWPHGDAKLQEQFPLGLAFFSPEENCAAVLGLRYFGELKKGTLTLAWGIAARNGYASCHGGLKRYTTKDGKKFVLAAFGLSGSGKSTITHAKHDGKYEVMVLHDDAFVVNVKDKYAIALEPTYFDKVADYPIGCDANKYLLTMQNCGVVLTKDGKKIAVTEDVRNGNGRAIKSRLWSPNRVDRIDEPLNAIFWLMRDPTIPPVLKLEGPSLGAVLGATLATKRTSAERLAPGVDPNALVCEPYANPFRTYPLGMDYERFKKLIEDGVDCYILNTGDFMGQKVQPKHTLGAIEAIVEGRAEWVPFGNLTGVKTINMPDFKIDFNDKNYKDQLRARFQDRLNFVNSRDTERGGIDKLPEDAHKCLEQLIAEMK